MAEVELINYFEEMIQNLMPSLDIDTVKKEVKIDGKIADMIVRTKDDDMIIIEVKSSGEPSDLFKAISQLRYYQTDPDQYLMVAVPKITEKGKEICKKAGIGYMDMQGQIFIKYKNKLIDKIAEMPVPKAYRRKMKRVRKLFSRDSLRCFIVMLNNPNKWFTQKDLSNETGISKGYINRILKTLESGVKADSHVLVIESSDERKWTAVRAPNAAIIMESKWREPSKKKFALRKTREYKIRNPSRLLDIISSQYDFSKNKIVSLYSFEKDPFKLMRKIARQSKELKLDYSLTLHSGASQIAPHVRFDDVYFYAKNEDISKWIKALDLKETEIGGNVFLVIPDDEWALQQKQKVNLFNVANNIRLYLDLINYPKRGKEQAIFLRDKKLGY